MPELPADAKVVHRGPVDWTTARVVRRDPSPRADLSDTRLGEPTGLPYRFTGAELRVRAAIMAMPGGGVHRNLHDAGAAVGFDRTRPCPITPEAVAPYLEILVQVRTAECDQHAAAAKRLAEIEAAVAGFRSVMGGKS